MSSRTHDSGIYRHNEDNTLNASGYRDKKTKGASKRAGKRKRGKHTSHRRNRR